MTKKRSLLVSSLFPILLFLLTTISASAQSPSGSAVTSAPSNPPATSDNEIKKVAIRALDKVAALEESGKAKDAVIAAQDDALKAEREAKEAFKQSALDYKGAFDHEKSANDIAAEASKADAARIRKLESQVRKSDSKVKWMAVGAVVAVVATIFVQRRP